MVRRSRPPAAAGLPGPHLDVVPADRDLDRAVPVGPVDRDPARAVALEYPRAWVAIAVVATDPDHRHGGSDRVEQLLGTEPDVIASACPYCMTMLSDGVKEKQADATVQTRDILELVADALA